MNTGFGRHAKGPARRASNRFASTVILRRVRLDDCQDGKERWSFTAKNFVAKLRRCFVMDSVGNSKFLCDDLDPRMFRLGTVTLLQWTKQQKAF